MTAIAEEERAPLAFGVADSDETPQPRNLRLLPSAWLAFEEIVGKRGKSQWVAGFIGSVISAPQRWKEFRALAELRGESFSDALTRAVTLYRDSE